MIRSKYPYTPDYVVSPGEHLREFLELYGWSHEELAQRCGCSPRLISEIESGRAPLEANMARKFERVLGMKAYMWLGMEQDYRQFLAREAKKKEAAVRADWAKKFPIKQLVKLGKVEGPSLKDSLDTKVLSFFGVTSIAAWEQRYGLEGVAWRHSQSYKSEWKALATWLRLGEIEADDQKCPDFNKSQFMQSVGQIRSMTRKMEAALPQAQKLCNEAGVALAIVPSLPKAAVSGAAYWRTPKKAVIQLSGRHLSDDHLWFSFFHEAAHILLHSKKHVFIEEKEGSNSQQEVEADEWASNFLVSKKDWDCFVSADRYSAESIEAFAEDQDIAPGIVVGRLQHEKRISWGSRLNRLKGRIHW